MRGILGGTFDPPHLAHLAAGEAAFRQLGLDVVHFVPAGTPWQKPKEEVTPEAERWEMTLRAVGGIDYFVADDCEVHRNGPTFTIDTLEQLGDERVTLILGADAAAGLPTWHRAEDVLDRVTVAVVPRPGVERAAVWRAVPGAVWLDMPELAISGTDLRRRARRGESIRFYVREAVWQYIVDRGLYA